MKTGPVNIYKKESFSMYATNYYFYDLIVRPYNQSAQKWVTIPIIVKYDYPSNYRSIGTYYVESRNDNNELELIFRNALSYNCLRSKFDLQTAENIKIPIMKLIKSKWGKNYVESIFNYIYSELRGFIPYCEYSITKEINHIRINNRLVYANEVLLINDCDNSEEVFNDCNQILKGIRRRKKLNRISQRMDHSQYDK